MVFRGKEEIGNQIKIRTNIQPGDVGAIVYLHGKLYAEEYGFDHTFEPYVAAPLAEFVKKQANTERLWIVEIEGHVMGSIAIVDCGHYNGQLRWLIVHPDLRGRGIGKILIDKALIFSKDHRYTSVFLWTIDFLMAARSLYVSAGFRRTETKTHRIWGRRLTEERYQLDL